MPLRRAYPTAPSTVSMGPWTGGLNSESADEVMPNNVLSRCINYMVKASGSLRLRPQVRSECLTAEAFPHVPTTSLFCKSMGSVIGPTQTLKPFIAVGTVSPTTGTVRHTYTTKFYTWDLVANAWVQAWDDNVQVESAPTSNIIGADYVPSNVVFYNGFYYFATSLFGQLNQQAAFTGTLTQYLDLSSPPHTTPSWGIADNGTDVIGILGIVMLKDRMFVIDPMNIYWSKATDPTVWASPDGGTLHTRRPDGDSINCFVVFNEALYYFKDRSIWRLSFSADPGVDGVNECITSEIGAVDCEVYDDELYISNGRGLYKLTNGFFTELSGQVRSQFRGAASDSMTQNLNNYVAPQYGFGLHKLNNMLLCGPLNDNAILRGDETTPDSFTGNYYLVYDIDRNTWTSWQFSPNPNTSNAVSGPTQKPVPYGINPSAPIRYVWIGQTLDGGALGTGFLTRLQNPFSVAVQDLIEEPSVPQGNDIGGTGAGVNKWIGGVIETGIITAGSNIEWKRLFATWLNADYNDITFDTGESSVGYRIDGEVTPNPVVSGADVGRVAIGGGYRFHRMSFVYDSITGVIDNESNPPELNNVDQVLIKIAASQLSST